MKHFLFIFILHTASFILCPAQDSPCNQGRATPPRVDPRSEQLICMPEYARSSFYSIWPLGDINHDGIDDWALPDSGIQIYYGKQGRLPTLSEYIERVRPTEDTAIIRYITYGDWDGDGHTDLCVSIQLRGDTSFGNVGANYDIGHRAILWGDTSGHFSIHDSTRLPPLTGQTWAVPPYMGVSCDFDNDGIQDLYLAGAGSEFQNGKWVPAPRAFIYRGLKNMRWGGNGVSAIPIWQSWSRPGASKIVIADQDGDKMNDLIFYNYANGSGTVSVSILYGRKNALPDTNDVETADLRIANGHGCLFSDVTGDGVPELLVHAGSEEQVKVFIGLKGQRLLEQYGTGNDSAQPGQQKWWGKPWAKIWLPHRMNDWWAGTTDAVLDLGDADLDGVNDIWVNCAPYLMVYSSGEFLDSLADAIVDVRPTGISNASYERVEAVMKNIDGSNIPTIVIGTVSGTIFVRGTKAVPSSYGKYRVLPEGTGKPTNGVEDKPSTPTQSTPDLTQRR